ncbi:hypothetical protein [Streptomyces sp. NRRL F-2747]|uniref:hypothetical protein n=1 Tax=Streptomyces sp. NRRL F-2747 TaxID=1463843 RepID=UPI0004CC6D16|nr:hypothetical protein [Streptomyces sp. NRRL F-2747]
MFALWRQAETAKWVDVVSGFLASRHPRGSAERAEVEGKARAVREEVDAGDPYAASGAAATWLAIALHAFEDDPHRPGPLRPAEEDAQVRDYLKDVLRHRLSRGQRDRLDRHALSLRVVPRRLCENPAVDARTREDVRYLVARGLMALDLGHVDAAEREVGRLEAIEERYRSGGCG